MLTYKQLAELINSGVDTMAAIQSQYGIGDDCGGCLNAIQEYFAAVQEAQAAVPAAKECDGQINSSAVLSASPCR